MPAEDQQPVESRPARPWFTTTHWSVVLRAGEPALPEASQALEQLCRAYWYPLYAYVRRHGHGHEDAQDLIQDFFWRLIEGDWLAQVDRRQGRCRSFLLVAMNHFLANAWDRATAVKRGGRVLFQSLDAGTYDRRFQEDAPLERSPEELYERRWAITLLETVLGRLRDEATASGQSSQFGELEVFLTGEKRTMTYGDLAARMATTEAALKMAVQRLRRRYGELLREEIANTVADPAEVEDELRHLMGVWSG